tara:strand:- start:200 stop:364 length:165 start_codon:yes stop_codon:yes gene_type:complete
MNREKLEKRLSRMNPKSGHAKVLRRKLGLDAGGEVAAPVVESVAPKKKRATKKK